MNFFKLLAVIAFSLLLGTSLLSGQILAQAGQISYNTHWAKALPGQIILPAYPPNAKKAELVMEAKVKLAVTIDERGLVKDCQVIRDYPMGYGFADEALKAIFQWRFEPSLDSTGQVISNQTIVDFVFPLPEK